MAGQYACCYRSENAISPDVLVQACLFHLSVIETSLEFIIASSFTKQWA